MEFNSESQTHIAYTSCERKFPLNMPSEQVKMNQSSSEDGEMHKQLDREIKEMVSAITHRVTNLHKFSGSGSGQHLEDEEDGGARIITLAGTNNGATMRSELDEKSGQSHEEEPEALSTYVNSNFQAINNSIMLGGSYQANDPGVHMDISEFTEPQAGYPHHKGEKEKKEKKEKKGKKKEKENSKSDHHSEHSD